jgi:hypothetical protein
MANKVVALVVVDIFKVINIVHVDLVLFPDFKIIGQVELLYEPWI